MVFAFLWLRNFYALKKGLSVKSKRHSIKKWVETGLVCESQKSRMSQTKNRRNEKGRNSFALV
jgi:hypothetical protein